jgi:hypothetical protein
VKELIWFELTFQERREQVSPVEEHQLFRLSGPKITGDDGGSMQH